MRLREAVEVAVLQVRAGDALRPVSVVVPSPLLGTWLSREVFAERGHVGIDFVSAHELAWRIAMPALLVSGRARVPENADLALLLETIPGAIAVGETPSYLRAAAETSGFAPALLRTLVDLTGAGVTPEALEAAAGEAADPGRLRLLARLVRGYAARLDKAGLVDRADLLRAATAALPSPTVGRRPQGTGDGFTPAPEPDGGVVLCALADPSAAERRFFEALSRHQPFACIAPPVPSAGAPRHAARRALLAALSASTAGAAQPAPGDGQGQTSALARLQGRLFAEAPGAVPSGGGELDASVTVLAAAGESMEAVEIARAIQALAVEGVAFDEIAVLLRQPSAYGPVLAAAFDRAGIEAYFLEGGPRLDPAARGLSLLLGLVDADLDRARVMEFVTGARVRFDNVLAPETEISPSRWDRLSAEAGIVAGLDNWRRRLGQASQRRAEREYAEDRDLKLYESLGRLIERLAADLARLPAQGAWRAMLAVTLDLLETWIVDGELTRDRLLRVLGPMADHAPSLNASRAAFLARVQEVLATQVYREGELGEGRVFVGSIRAARGMRFRAVFVPGLVERAFPMPVRPDPLLLDEERERLSPDLRTTRDGMEAERLLFFDAARCAGERLVLSYPRFDTAGGRERIPSSFLLHAVEAALGRRVTAAQLAALARSGETELGRPHPSDAATAIDRVERDLALVSAGARAAARHLAGADTLVSRALEQARAAWEPTWTAWEGALDGPTPEALARLRLADQHTSVTRVQTFAACPYRHFLATGLRLRRWEEPAREYRMLPIDYGSVFHEIVHRLFAGLAEQGALPPRPADVPRLAPRVAELVDEELAQHAAENGVRNPALLDPARLRLRADVEGLLRDEARALALDGFVPTEFEREFEGVEISLGDGAAVRFRGTIDRIDTAKKGRGVRVVDYKTGGHFWKKDEQWKGGTELQLAVYNAAARALAPGRPVAEAVYYYSTEKGGYKRKGLPAEPEQDDTLQWVLSTLDAQAASGVFPAVADNCRYCDFQLVCGEGRDARAARKAGDPRVAAFLKLREIP